MKKKPTCTTYEISKTSQNDLSEEASQNPLQKDIENLSKISPKPLGFIFPERPLKNLYKKISKTSTKYLQNLSDLSFQRGLSKTYMKRSPKPLQNFSKTSQNYLFRRCQKLSPNTSLKVTTFPQKKIIWSGHFRHLRPHEKDVSEMFGRYQCSVGVRTSFRRNVR